MTSDDLLSRKQIDAITAQESAALKAIAGATKPRICRRWQAALAPRPRSRYRRFEMPQPQLKRTPAQKRFDELTLELEALLDSPRPRLEILPEWRELLRQLVALEI